jgi:hypothetical protein
MASSYGFSTTAGLTLSAEARRPPRRSAVRSSKTGGRATRHMHVDSSLSVFVSLKSTIARNQP